MHLLLVFSLLICIVSSTDTQRHTLPTYLTPTPSDTRCCLLTHTTCCAHTIRTVPTHLSPASSDMHGCFLTRSCYADNVSWECDDSAGYGTLGQDKQYCRCLRCSPSQPEERARGPLCGRGSVQFTLVSSEGLAAVKVRQRSQLVSGQYSFEFHRFQL